MYPELKSRLATIAEANMNRVNKVRSRADYIFHAHARAQPFLNHLGAFFLPELSGWICRRESELSVELAACTPPRRQRDL
jgi:hypothetical protein